MSINLAIALVSTLLVMGCLIAISSEIKDKARTRPHGAKDG